MRGPYQNQYRKPNYPTNYQQPYPYPQNTYQRPYDMNVQSQFPNVPNYNQGYYPPNQVPSNSIQKNQLSLKSLESMRERGLISEENYFKKLKELGY